MSRNGFISQDLHKIRTQLPGSASSEEVDDKKDPSEPKAGKQRGSNGKELERELRRRRQEFVKTRQDIMSRLTEALALLPEMTRSCEQRLERLRASRRLYEELLEKVKILDESALELNTEKGELGTAMRTVENARLELVRNDAKLSDPTSDTLASLKPGEISIAPELSSLSFKQLSYLGFSFCFPIIVAILLSAFFIGLIMLISMRVFNL